MLDTHVRTSYGSFDAATQGVGPTTRPQGRAAQTRDPQAPQPTSIATQGPGFISHVVAPLTLLAAQEARDADPIRRDDAHKNAARGQNQEQAHSAPESAAEEDPTPKDVAGADLTEEEQQQLDELQAIDREVRAHERAHRSAGGTLTGPAQFTYTRGPDGQLYATSGEVSIDTGREATAAATVDKMEAVIRAALAPTSPSSQDFAVAAQARKVLNEARGEAQKERLDTDGAQSASDPTPPDDATSADTSTPHGLSLREANQAYRARGAQDEGAFLAQQARDAYAITADQGFSFII